MAQSVSGEMWMKMPTTPKMTTECQ